jgi:ATP-dependent DNA helicase RecQ
MARIDRTARDALGLDNLRAGQRRAIDAAVDGRDVLAIMRTGYGKSAIYQIAAIERPGITVVISPLLALQTDQLASIEGSEAPSAVALNSTLTSADRDAALDAVRRGEIEFVFIAPEQLRRHDVLELLSSVRPSLLVVDEAHCISTLGHDFRPDYLLIGAAADAFGRPPILALTATASPAVRGDVAASLGLRDPSVVVTGIDRPEIHLGVESHANEETRERALLEHVIDGPAPAIVYVATRAAATSLAASLAEAGCSAMAYHGGMPAAQRDVAQAAFMGGRADVMVATDAFGLGIDKADVRAVVHRGLRPSLDAYYQEVGRAARDGERAEAVLFHTPSDRGRQAFIGAAAAPDEAALAALLHAIPTRPIDAESLSEVVGGKIRRLWQMLALLVSSGVVEISPPAGVRRTKSARVALASALQVVDRRRAMQRSRLEMMRSYAETRWCRRAFILGYFGEDFSPPCGGCDVCDAADAGEADGPLEGGTRVRHAEWGDGTVLTSTEHRTVVQFDRVGYRQLATDLVERRGLLEPATDAAAPRRR